MMAMCLIMLAPACTVKETNEALALGNSNAAPHLAAYLAEALECTLKHHLLISIIQKANNLKKTVWLICSS